MKKLFVTFFIVAIFLATTTAIVFPGISFAQTTAANPSQAITSNYLAIPLSKGVNNPDSYSSYSAANQDFYNRFGSYPTTKTQLNDFVHIGGSDYQNVVNKYKTQYGYYPNDAQVVAWKNSADVQAGKPGVIDYLANLGDKETAAMNNLQAKVECSADFGTCLTNFFYNTIEFVGNVVLSTAAWILWACGIMLNLSIVTFVIHMKDLITNIGAIFTVWQTVRDLANMFFIFILLYIAIDTILGGNKWKETLRNVILIALFINFSFFITGVMIDASNIMALQFYNGFAGSSCSGVNVADGCMSQKVVNALRLGTIYNKNVPVSSNPNDPNAPKSANTPTFDGSSNTRFAIGPFLITVIFGSILMIVAGGIFIASAILIFYRFIELIMVLMFSPIALAAFILPSTKKYWNKWWDKLITQLIFAPVYFMFLWVTMRVIQSGTLGANTGASVSLAGNNTFTDGFSGNPIALFGLIANYVIIIMMLGYSLALAKELGASGVDVATKAAKGVQGFVGRNTVGRASSRIANSKTMKDFASNSAIGRLAQKPFTSLAKQSFGDKGVKGGFEQTEKDYVKKQEEFAKTLGPTSLQTKRAKDAQAAAVSERIQQRKEIENKVNTDFAREEAKVSPEKITEAEKELGAQKEAMAKQIEMSAKTVNPEKVAAEKDLEQKKAAAEEIKMKVSTHGADATISEADKAKDRQAASAADGAVIAQEQAIKKLADDEEKKKQQNKAALEKAIAEKEKSIENMRKRQEEIKRQKEDRIKEAIKPYDDKVSKADERAGLDIKDAKERIKAENPGINDKDLEAKAKEIVTGGAGKERQEKFAQRIGNSWFVSPSKKTAASSGIRKNVIKDKTEVEKLYAELEKMKGDGEKKDEKKPEESKGDDKK